MGKPGNRTLPQLKCRICKTTLRLQHYKDHLKNKHPSQDKNDLRGYGQPKLFDMKATKKRKVDDDLTDDSASEDEDEDRVLETGDRKSEEDGAEREPVGGLDQGIGMNI